MNQMTEAYEWTGRQMVDRDGEKIGKLEQIYLDTETGAPEWAAVNTGMFGTQQSFVPIVDAAPAGGKVQVPYEKDQVKAAPKIAPDGELSVDEEGVLYRHYGRDYAPV